MGPCLHAPQRTVRRGDNDQPIQVIKALTLPKPKNPNKAPLHRQGVVAQVVVPDCKPPPKSHSMAQHRQPPDSLRTVVPPKPFRLQKPPKSLHHNASTKMRHVAPRLDPLQVHRKILKSEPVKNKVRVTVKPKRPKRKVPPKRPPKLVQAQRAVRRDKLLVQKVHNDPLPAARNVQ